MPRIRAHHEGPDEIDERPHRMAGFFFAPRSCLRGREHKRRILAGRWSSDWRPSNAHGGEAPNAGLPRRRLCPADRAVCGSAGALIRLRCGASPALPPRPGLASSGAPRRRLGAIRTRVARRQRASVFQHGAELLENLPRCRGHVLDTLGRRRRQPRHWQWHSAPWRRRCAPVRRPGPGAPASPRSAECCRYRARPPCRLCQVCAGKLPPVTRAIGVKSSLPSQTPVTYCPVKPMNQASR